MLADGRCRHRVLDKTFKAIRAKGRLFELRPGVSIRLFTIGEFAYYVGLKLRTIRDLMEKGRFPKAPFFSPAGVRLFSWAHIQLVQDEKFNHRVIPNSIYMSKRGRNFLKDVATRWTTITEKEMLHAHRADEAERNQVAQAGKKVWANLKPTEVGDHAGVRPGLGVQQSH